MPLPPPLFFPAHQADDPGTEEHLSRLRDSLAAGLATVVGHVQAGNITPSLHGPGVEACYTGQCGFGDMLADAVQMHSNRSGEPGIVLVHAGAIKAPLLQGYLRHANASTAVGITTRQIGLAVAQSETLVRLDGVLGSDIRELLQHSLSAVLHSGGGGNSQHRFLHLPSTMQFRWYAYKGTAHIGTVRVAGPANSAASTASAPAGVWSRLDNKTRYSLVTTSTVAAGGLGFSRLVDLANVTAHRGPPLSNVVEAFLATKTTVDTPWMPGTTAARITRELVPYPSCTQHHADQGFPGLGSCCTRLVFARCHQGPDHDQDIRLKMHTRAAHWLCCAEPSVPSQPVACVNRCRPDRRPIELGALCDHVEGPQREPCDHIYAAVNAINDKDVGGRCRSRCGGRGCRC